MKLRFIADFAENWKAGDVVEAKVLSNGDTLVDDVVAVDTTLLMEHCEVVKESEGQEMTRLEENKMMIELLMAEIKRKPTGTYEEMMTFQLGAITTILTDISKSLAVIAYKAESE